MQGVGYSGFAPDINHSTDKFTVEPDGIRFGLGAVKNVGRGLIRTMTAKRNSGGPFRSLEDFLRRMEEGDLNKRVVENLIKCGAMDCFGLYRSQLLAIYEPAMEAVADSRRRNVEGQMGMFAMLDDSEPGIQCGDSQHQGNEPLGAHGDGKGDDRPVFVRPPYG